MPDVIIAMGSNLNDRRENLRYALDLMSSFFRLYDVSFLYETEPKGFIWQGWFINAVVSGSFEEDPLELLMLLRDIEIRMGRQKRFVNAPRMIDLDIISFEDIVVATNELSLPHTRMVERKFVLLPIKDIAPDYVHPALGLNIDELIEQCPDDSRIYRVGHLWKKDDIPESDTEHESKSL